MKYLFCLLLVACIFDQKPVCPSHKPNCTMDHDPVIQGKTVDAGKKD